MVRRAVYDGCPSVSPPLLLRAFPAIFLGERSARSGHVHQAAVDGFLATFEATRPAYGAATWIEVSGAFRSWGVRKEPRVGYSIGLNWDDDGAGLQRDDETIIQSKMTFHLIVGIWQNSEGSIFSETVRLAENEAKSLSSISRDLLVNPPWMNVRDDRQGLGMYLPDILLCGGSPFSHPSLTTAAAPHVLLRSDKLGTLSSE